MVAFSPYPPNHPNTFWDPCAKKIIPRVTRTTVIAHEAGVATSSVMSGLLSCCRLHRRAETSGNPGADLRVHAAPVLQHAIDDVAPDACHEVGDQVADHVLLVAGRAERRPEGQHPGRHPPFRGLAVPGPIATR